MKDMVGKCRIGRMAGGGVVVGLMMLNAYVQRIARGEERQRLERISAENLKRERLAAAQSRRPDNI